MAEMQAFYDAITPRAEEAIAYCDKFSLDDMPEDVLEPDAPAVFDDHGVVPGRMLEAAARSRLGRRHPRLRGRTVP